MFDSTKELLEKIRLGEDTFLEYKDVRISGERIAAPSRKALADGLAAFANSKGGVFVLGVEDKKREIRGIPFDRLESAELLTREVCRDAIEPPIAPVIERLRVRAVSGSDVAIIKIDVPRSLFVHRSPSGYMYRIGSEKRRMSSEYLARLFMQRSQSRLIRFDEQTVSDATMADLSIDMVERFRTPLTTGDWKELSSKLHMARKEAGELKPTIAGTLMAAQGSRTWLPNAFIQAVAYRGTTITTGSDDPYQLDAADITGPLDRQVVAACLFVARNMKVAAFKDIGRTDRPQFDMAAVFEAIVNAVAHRDYSIHGSKIRLRIFQDRLELYSPGAIANTIELDELPYIQATRNEVLTSLLAKCPIPPDIPRLITDRKTMMDRRGEGVPVILENSIKLSGRTPEYRLLGNAELMLTIFAPAEPST